MPHVYMDQDMSLTKGDMPTRFPRNYEYHCVFYLFESAWFFLVVRHSFFLLFADVFPSTFVEDQPIHKLIGTFEACHATIGEPILCNKATSPLFQEKVFLQVLRNLHRRRCALEKPPRIWHAAQRQSRAVHSGDLQAGCTEKEGCRGGKKGDGEGRKGTFIMQYSHRKSVINFCRVSS